MNRLKLLYTAFSIGIFSLANAQTDTTIATSAQTEYSGFRVSVRGGYDFPSIKFKEITPFLNYKGGPDAGISVDYYWNWFGIGADLDYIRNKPENTFPTSGYSDPNEYPITKFDLIENKITRIFYGIGPDFRFLQTPKSDFELKLRGGLSSVQGGEVQLTGQADNPQAYAPILLNYHGGFYGKENVFAGKASLQYNYFFSRNVGLHVGGYYLYHSKVYDQKGSTTNFTSGYMPLSYSGDVARISDPDDLIKRIDPVQDKVQSFGVFAGLIFRFNKKVKVVEEPKVVIPAPVECVIVVTAKDKYTGEIIPNAQITLLDGAGNTIKSATTDVSGVTTFNGITKGSYTVAGSYQGKMLEGNLIADTEFDDCTTTGGIKKDVLLNDENYIVMGKVVNCKTSEPISDATVIVKNNKTGATETYTSDTKGEFSFTAQPNTTYTIYGKKANYLSQNVTVKTSDYNRTKSQYIQIQICMDKADCNDAIVLKDILYDLDKSFIREDAKPELNRLVQFMKDNPEVRVELSSHTDSRGSDSYNMKLSQRRAQAAVDYIISQGIVKSRLIAKGYGESKLLNRCANGVKCTEEEHQLNRRTEMKVVCPDSK